MSARFAEIAPAAALAARGTARLVDVREAAELTGELGCLDGVEHVPLARLADHARAWRRDEPIILVCRSGARSARGAQQLADAGFAHVYNLTGGMIAVRAAGVSRR